MPDSAGDPPADLPADLSADLALALRLADAADAISLDRFGARDLRVRSKPDLTPVTDADLAVEQAVRDILAEERPADQVVGEEFGAKTVDPAGRSWILDPIDGTKNYVRGVPVWATLIALLHAGRPVVGVVSAPALARRWWAAVDGPAWSSFAGGPARRLAVSGVAAVADASLSFSELAEWRAAGREQAFADLVDDCWRTRGYGDFLSYVLVAEGAVDIAAEPTLSLWDVAALAPVVTAAGGRLTDVDGAPIDPGSTSALATNGLLHDQVRTRLAAARRVTPR